MNMRRPGRLEVSESRVSIPRHGHPDRDKCQLNPSWLLRPRSGLGLLPGAKRSAAPGTRYLRQSAPTGHGSDLAHCCCNDERSRLGNGPQNSRNPFECRPHVLPPQEVQHDPQRWKLDLRHVGIVRRRSSILNRLKDPEHCSPSHSEHAKRIFDQQHGRHPRLKLAIADALIKRHPVLPKVTWESQHVGDREHRARALTLLESQSLNPYAASGQHGSSFIQIIRVEIRRDRRAGRRGIHVLPETGQSMVH